MPWEQEGDFDKVLQDDGHCNWNRRVHYFNITSRTDIDAITLIGYKKSEKERCVIVHFSTIEALDDFKRLVPQHIPIYASSGRKEIYIQPTERIDDLADFVRTIYKKDSLDKKTRLGIALCLKFTVEITKEPAKPLNADDRQHAMMRLLNEIKAQNDLLINKVQALEADVSFLKKQNHELKSLATERITEQPKSGNYGLFTSQTQT